MNFIREKRIYCGEQYMEVDLIPKSRTEKIVRKGKRSKKKKVSAPKQKRLNNKNAKRYFNQIIKANFGVGDFHVSLTYSPDELPRTIEDGDKEVKNYIDRVNYRRKKKGLPNAKYVYVTEYSEDNDTGETTRMHHHIIMDGGLDRDTLEDAWCRRRKKDKKRGRR